MVRSLNMANIYVLLWILYGLQGFLYPVGTFFSQFLLLFLLLVSLYYCYVANSRYNLPSYFIGLNLLLALFSVYGVYLMIGGYNSAEYALQVGSFEYLKGIFKSLLPIYAFYVFFNEKKMTEKLMPVCIVLFLFLVTVDFYVNYKVNLMAAKLVGSKAEEFSNNVGYEFLALLPICVFIYKRPILQYIVVGYCSFFLLLAMKRGAILIGAVCLIWFLWNNLRNASIKVKVVLVVLSLLLCSFSYQFIQNQLEKSVLFQKRIENTLDGNVSGRDDLYSSGLNYFWNESTPLQFIFGSGANATLKVLDNYAHNDWLEIAVNQGIIGLFVYVIYWILFMRTAFSKKYEPHIKLAIQLVFLIYFMRTIVSMSYSAMTVCATFTLGYCLAKEKKDGQVCECN